MTENRSESEEIRISGDSHAVEPIDLWIKKLPPELLERVPTGPGSQFDSKFWDYGKPNYTRLGGRDALQRLKDMAVDGISAEVLFPTQAQWIFQQFFSRELDVELAKGCERVYNDWITDFCNAAPDRLWGLAFLGLWDIDHAVKEMERTRNEGLKGIATWVAPPKDLPWTSSHYERFWSAAEDLDVPVCMHTSNGFGSYQKYKGPNEVSIGSIDPVVYISRKAIGHTKVAMHTLADLILSGVFERHPRLRVMLAEFECGWIPFFLEQLDRMFYSSKEIKLPSLPSEYFSQCVYATFMQDGVAGFSLQRWGADNFIYSNDYPHQGGIWPYTDETIELTLKSLSPETRRKVLSGNVARLFGQKVPEPIVRRDVEPGDDPNHNWSRPWIRTPENFTFDKAKMGLST